MSAVEVTQLRCDQCGRVGVRGFKTIPTDAERPTDGLTTFTVCENETACRKRWVWPNAEEGSE